MSEMTIRTAVNVNATASDAWGLLGEGFGDWADWAPGLDSSRMDGPLEVGAIRVNKAESLGTVTQQLVSFDPDRRSLAYEMREGLPPFFEAVRNDWIIVELEAGKVRLQGEALFVLKDEAETMANQLKGKMGVTLEVFANAFRDKLEG